ncbi:hypothetical protein DEO72_LG5g445 [Vigna unguiculata]|uniref:Uncharacterized protein n=1 Tax=Vigna unguiculata TaxID=3917 RepID=A0A4D6LVB4_VIGUN|nr:hypothetical protein DEO72_LG5g445 [Vigna unguiculata]
MTIDYQFLFFDITALLKFDKVTDFSGILILYCTLTFSLISKGSTNFIIIVVLTLVIKGSWYFRQIILTLFVGIWGTRLALFMLFRALSSIRGLSHISHTIWTTFIPNSFSFHLSPFYIVWTVSLPVTLVNASDRNPFLHVVDIIGWILVRLALWMQLPEKFERVEMEKIIQQNLCPF